VKENIKVILVDDQKLWRESFSGHLNSLSGIKVVGMAADGGELFEMIKTTAFDVVLLDLEIRIGMDGIRTLKFAEKKGLNIKFIMLSGHAVEDVANECLKLGARGYLTKNTDFELVGEAIFEVHNKGYCQVITNKIIKKSVEALFKELYQKYNLIEREIKVLIGLVYGKALKIIASELDLSQRSINRLLKQITKKTGAKGRGEMICFAVVNGLALKI